MATSENCRSLCGVVHLTEAQTRLMRERIEQEYHVHLYVELTSRVYTVSPKKYHIKQLLIIFT